MLPLDQLPILLVEDSDDDLFFFKRLLAKTGIKPALAIATDGQQAVAYLERALSDTDLPKPPPVPVLIFLDLKLPLKGGFEVLKWIRTQNALAQTVVVILSSSAESRDVVQAFQWGAQSYLVKYPEPAILADVVHRVAALGPVADLSTLELPGLRP
jgi:CheY-like chemotaxis protein